MSQQAFDSEHYNQETEVYYVERGKYRLVLSRKRKRKLIRRGERVWWSHQFGGWLWDYWGLPF